MAVYFDAHANRLPAMDDDYPIELRLAWQSVCKAYRLLEQHQNDAASILREINKTIKILSARFGIIFDCWYDGLFRELLDYDQLISEKYAEEISREKEYQEQMREERPR